MSRALVELFADRRTSANLAFRGGTALHKLHFRPAARFSEDIDLVQVGPASIGDELDLIRERLAWLGKANHSKSDKGHKLTFRFQTELPPVVRRKLKVEINTRDHLNLRGLERRVFIVESQWFNGSAAIPTFTLEEMLATKLRALYERRKGRDVFDLAYALQQVPKPDPGDVIACFNKYMAGEGKSVTGREFLDNFDAKCAWKGFLSEIESFLAPSVSFDPIVDVERVRTQLLARLGT